MPFIVDVVFLFGNESQMSLDSLLEAGTSKLLQLQARDTVKTVKELERQGWTGKKSHENVVHETVFKSNVKHE